VQTFFQLTRWNLDKILTLDNLCKRNIIVME